MPTARLIFVTGRGLESVLPLLSDRRIPNPDYIIADVGAAVVHGDTLEPVQFPGHRPSICAWIGPVADGPNIERRSEDQRAA